MKTSQMQKSKNRFIIFSDLDGTLLDHHTYSFQAASKALKVLKILDIPLILTSSKTLLEIREVQTELEINYPFIIENGSGICFPSESHSDLQNYEKIDETYVDVLGENYPKIIDDLRTLRNRYEFDFKGFHEMSVEEVMSITGLDYERASKAKKRLCSEPIRWEDSSEKYQRFKNELQFLGYRIFVGGRFLHIMGNSDKGKAVVKLLKYYQGKFETTKIKSIGVGDSPNDIDLLSVVDIPILVKRPDGTYIDVQIDKKVIHAPGIGPIGWGKAVKMVIANNPVFDEDG